MCSGGAYKAPAPKPLPPPVPAAEQGPGAPLINEGFGFVTKLADLQASNKSVVPFKMPLNPYVANIEQLAQNRASYINSLTYDTRNYNQASNRPEGQAALTWDEQQQVAKNRLDYQDSQQRSTRNRRHR